MNAAEADDAHGRALLEIARGTLEETLCGALPARAERADWLAEPGAVFVSLEHAGELRGCVGTVRPYRALYDDVRGNTRAAALNDYRFERLGADEARAATLEVAWLSELEQLGCESEPELLAALRPGLDGLVLECGRQGATFLPKVWESLARPVRFVQELKRKAGLPLDFWPDEMVAYRYTTRSWREQRV